MGNDPKRTSGRGEGKLGEMLVGESRLASSADYRGYRRRGKILL